MRPIEIYELPSRHTRPWHDDLGSMRRLFGYGSGMGEFDLQRAEAEAADDLAFATKINRYVGQDATLSFDVAELGGRPFALLACAGEDGHRALVTDPALHAEARAYVEAYREFDRPGTVAVDEDIPELDRIYGHTVMPLRGRPEFVPDWHLSPEGRPIIDHVAYHEAFEHIVRPAYSTRDGAAFENGLGDEGMRRLAAQAILEGLGEGLVGTTSFEPLQGPLPEGQQPLDWIAVLATDGNRTYGIGLPAHAPRRCFTWVGHPRPCMLGPAWLYGELAVPAS